MVTDKILSIVIPVYNKYNFTKSCLKDLSYLPNDHEIIIVDNGSSDETQLQLKDSKEILYFRLSTNTGFARGSNFGYGRSSAMNVLFLNNDIRVKENHSTWTKELIEKCSDGLVGPTMGQLDNDLNFLKEANEILPGKSYMSGWCLASSKEIFSKLWIPRNETRAEAVDQMIPQIFSEEFGIAYFEDTDLGFRAQQLHIKMQVIDIPVVHFGKQTSKQLNTYQLYKQAREIFVKKWKK